MITKYIRLISGLLLLLLLISSCTYVPTADEYPEVAVQTTVPDETNTVEPTPVVEPALVTATAGITPEKQPEEPSPLSYEINAELDYGARKVEVDQLVQVNGLLSGLSSMAMVVEPNRYYRGFELHSLEFNQTPVDVYSLEGNQLRSDIPETTANPQQSSIHLVYTLVLPEIPPPSEMFKPQPYGYTDRQLNLVDWFAIIPPLDENNEWIIHNPPIFGESLVYPAADFTIRLTIGGYHQPLSVAASSPATQLENTYSYSMQAARTFAVSISPYYNVVEGESNGIKLRSYAFDGYDDQNLAVIQNAAEALALFTELYGPLPHTSVSIVQADFLDGMEYDGLYFVSKGFYDLYDGSVQGYLSLITVHEMAHQWWFSAVGSDQAMEPWLDEGLATFGELQYIERYYPELVDWWWSYRVNYYEPEGKIDLAIYDYPSYTAYRNAVYLRGAAFFYDLKSELGEEVFYRGMKRYYANCYRQIAHKGDLFKAFSAEAAQVSSALLEEYFSVNP